MALSAERHEKNTVQPLLGTTYINSGGIVTLLCNGQTVYVRSLREKCNVEYIGCFFSCLTEKCRTDALVSSYWLLPLGSFV